MEKCTCDRKSPDFDVIREPGEDYYTCCKCGRLLASRLSSDQKKRWSVVKLDAVVKAANACCRGGDFRGSSKASIYDSYDNAVKDDGKNFHGTFDCERFVTLMNVLTGAEQQLAKDRSKAINELIRMVKS